MTDRPRGRPRAEPVEAQRRRILDVARDQFVERGYDDVTVAGIAAAAEVPRAVVYEVAGDKAKLVGAVFTEVADAFVTKMDEHHRRTFVDRPDDLHALVGAEVRWFLDALAADRTMRTLLAMSSRLGSVNATVADARRRVEDGVTRHHQELATTFGVDRDASARVVTTMVLAVVESIATRPELFDTWPYGETTDLVVAFVASAIGRVERPDGEMERFDCAAGSGSSSG
jgi:AcrR family transcriptional regulator